MKSAWWIGIGIALLGSAATGARTPAASDASAYVFGSPPVNALGLKGMSDLRGKPVLIDFWGTH